LAVRHGLAILPDRRRRLTICHAGMDGWRGQAGEGATGMTVMSCGFPAVAEEPSLFWKKAAKKTFVSLRLWVPPRGDAGAVMGAKGAIASDETCFCFFLGGDEGLSHKSAQLHR
jgi:hypothetical protein